MRWMRQRHLPLLQKQRRCRSASIPHSSCMHMLCFQACAPGLAFSNPVQLIPSDALLRTLYMFFEVTHRACNAQKAGSRGKAKTEGGLSLGRGGRPITWFGGGGMNPQ